MDRVVTSSLFGALFLFIVMGLALFLGAGTLRFWQAWVYLGVFFAGVTGITAALVKHDRKLLERRGSVGPLDEREPRQKAIQAVAGALFLGLLLLSGLDRRFGWSAVPVALVLASYAFIAAGLVVIHLVFKENTFASATIQVEKDQRVVSTGPYAIVRHPMYSGALVLILFTPLALGSSWSLLMGIPFSAVIVARLLDEERQLRRDLTGYEEYRAQVRFRLIPRIW